MRLTALMIASAVAALATPAAAQEIAVALAPGEVPLKVEAEGVSRDRPDQLHIRAGVVTTGRTAKEALAANNLVANRLLDAVKARGVAPADIRTDELSVRPQFDKSDTDRASDEGRSARIVGYVATDNLDLTLRDLGKGPDLVDALFEAGANSVHGPVFALSDPAPAQRRAREAAVAAAFEQATTYANALHMRVSHVLRISERGDFDEEREGYSIVVTGSRIPRTPLEPSELSTRIKIWIDYALAPR